MTLLRQKWTNLPYGILKIYSAKSTSFCIENEILDSVVIPGSTGISSNISLNGRVKGALVACLSW